MPILTPEKRFLTFETAEIRVKKTEKGPVIEGFAAKFDELSPNYGGFVEKIDKKAFARCLQRCDVRGLKNHEPGQLLGRTGSGTMRLSVRDEGLWYEIDAPDTQVGRDTLVELERKDITGSSFSFTLEDEDGDEWDDSTNPPTRTLMNVKDLFDVGPVTFPYYPGSSAGARAECRSFDRFIESQNQAAKLEADRLKAAKQKRIRLLKLRRSLGIS